VCVPIQNSTNHLFYLFFGSCTFFFFFSTYSSFSLITLVDSFSLFFPLTMIYSPLSYSLIIYIPSGHLFFFFFLSASTITCIRMTPKSEFSTLEILFQTLQWQAGSCYGCIPSWYQNVLLSSSSSFPPLPPSFPPFSFETGAHCITQAALKFIM
jgi:hypothetical protein